MKKYLIGILSIAVIFMLMLIFGCVEPKAPTQQQIEEKKVEDNIKKLSKQTDLPILDKSLERINIKNRLKLFEDENKVSYIYLVSYGKIMAFYTVKGKVSSGSKRLTTNQKLVQGNGGQYHQDFVVESPSLDGTYGSSDSYIYFWTTDGAYVQWNETYMLCDKPLKLAQEPLMVREVK